MSDVFKTLSEVNVNKFVEKKQGLTYLSWSNAWSETVKVYPKATYEIIKFNGLPYIYDEFTGYMCYTKVTIEDITHEMWLPVMDGANKAMKAYSYEYSTKYATKNVNAATMFDVNKTVMRCLVKNLAMFGLGIYIYKGEDLPEEPTKEEVKAMKFVKNAKASVLKAFCEEFVIDTNALLDNLCTSFTVDKKDVKSIDNVSNEMIAFFESNKQFYIDNLSLKDIV